MSTGMIVLAEDDPKLRKLYSDFFEVNGYTVAAAKDGVEAIGLLHGITPSVLILDIMMPNMDGIETCRRARKIIGGEVPVMFLTASDNLDRLQECVQAGGDDYIMKTQPLDRILERVKHWTRSSVRADMMARRTNVQKEVNVAVETHQIDWEHGTDLSSETDDTVRKMSVFIAQARSRAPDGFGKTVEQKLCLIGYVTGVVKHWAQIEKSLNSRFTGYLRAVLAETDMLMPDEIAQMIDAYDELSTEDSFEAACARGQHDCKEAKDGGAEFMPTGLTETSAAISA